jgi:carbon storage regulator CsrA
MHDANGIVAKIKVSRVTGNQVRLSFEADKNLKIDREEIYNANPPKN